MKSPSPLTLSGSHVRLEPLEHEHNEALLRAANESRSTYGLTFVPADAGAMFEYIATALGERDRGESIPFVVRDARGAVLGSTRYMAIERWRWTTPPKAPALVPEGPDAVEIGSTWYAERVQRTGTNTEAKLLLCTHAFETWRVRRITWKTDARNMRSRNAIERLGATFDGVLRANRPGADGEVRDTACYSMLAAEWPAAKEALVTRLARGASPSSSTDRIARSG